ncbi:MAG: geranylgeranyl reductase family protein [Rhodobacteraceae bacterium]|nr:geranylgeranyl reductase family protein [Paracoccaceae bacterium]
MIYDVIVVGGGPGGTSAANFLARQGISTLLLDKSSFPRDKVCGDGLTPQAVYWLARLNCADEVLAETKSCIRAADIIINKELVLTGGFPDGTIYPDFAILLDRRRFDNILLEKAIQCGARFEDKTIVRGLEYERDCVRVLAKRDRKSIEYRGRIVIGADGVSSAVSRAIGNTLKDGVLAVSVRAYYKNVKLDGSRMKVYFDRDYFPGYGWVFVDDDGFANIGLGCVYDKHFPILDNLGGCFQRFTDNDLGAMLADSVRCGPVSGGSSGFYRPKSIIGDRVMLIGDAANQADPLNGGGIHKAMESAHCAAEACRFALSVGEFSKATMSRYEHLWSQGYESDWRTAEIFMSIAKNPGLKNFSLFMLKQVGQLAAADPRFRDFAGGLFSGVISQSQWLVPRALYSAFPKDPATWMELLRRNGDEINAGITAGSMRLAYGTIVNALSAGLSLARSPVTNLNWGMELASKAISLAELQLAEAASRRANTAENLGAAGHKDEVR